MDWTVRQVQGWVAANPEPVPSQEEVLFWDDPTELELIDDCELEN